MRNSLSASVAVFALAAAASTAAHAGISADGAPLKPLAVLDCPAEQGALMRMAQAADGKSCDYQGRHGEKVHLALMPLQGRSPSAAMEATRAELHALLPVYNRPPPVADDGMTGDRADVDLPFLHVHAVGDHADVRLFGIKISSKGQNTDVDVGHGRKRSVVHAGPRGAEVMADEIGRSNASLVYVLAGNHRSPSGYRAVGYIAKGPVTGPLVVAEFRSIHDRHDHDGDHGDIGRLIDRNVRN